MSAVEDGSLAEISVGTTTYRVSVPHHATDYIQGKLRSTGEPYELGMLTAMARHLRTDDLVLDIGANIGNHTLFLAAVVGCRVEAFEPNLELTSALEESARLNGLSHRINVHQAGVGAAAARGTFVELHTDNLGGQKVGDLGPEGDFDIVALDDMTFDHPVRAMKIDVEGMEVDVLVGARELIARDRPVLYVECQDLEAFDAVDSWMRSQGYSYRATYNATPTHQYESVDAFDGAMAEVLSGLVRERYQARERELHLRETRDAAGVKYRNVGEQLAAARAELNDAKSRLDATRAELGGARDELAEARSEADTAARELAAAQVVAAESAATTASIDRKRKNAEIAFDRVRGEALRYRKERDDKQVALVKTRGALVKARSAVTAAKSQTAAAVKSRKKVERDLARLKNSRTLRAGRAVKAAIRSPWRLFKLPLTLVSLVQEESRKARAASKSVMKPAPAPVAAPKASSLTVSTLGATRVLDVNVLATRQSVAIRSAEALRAALSEDERPRVAAILDAFTRQCLDFECDIQDLHPETWLSELESFRPHILFVESAWRGDGGTWHNTVPNRPAELVDIVEWCRENGVPTVFWNKEDPVHFETFIATAGEFDHVLTTDIDRVGKYRALLGHDRVGFLPFAAQPRLHNPIEEMPRKDAMVFAGGFYKRYPERMRDLRAILDGLEGVLPVEIFDRNYGTTYEDYAFPEEYQRYIVGTLAPSDVHIAYKGYRFALNLNSVKGSQSMFARRAYELLACNTLTISNYAKGLGVIFGDLVPQSDSPEQTRRTVEQLTLDVDRADKLRAMGLRKVLAEHTYAERLRYILALASEQPFEPARPAARVVMLVRTARDAEMLARSVAAQQDVRLVVTALCADGAATEAVAAQGWDCHRIVDGDGTLLGTMFPDDGLPVVFFDPRDWYGPHYVADLVSAWQYADTESVGKGRRFVVDDGEVVLRGEDEYVVVSGGSPRRSAVTQAVASRLDAAELLHDRIESVAAEQFVVHRFDYCEGGGDAATAALNACVAETDVAVGQPLRTVYEVVENAVVPIDRDAVRILPLDQLPILGTTPEDSDVTTRLIRGDRYRIVSQLDDTANSVMWANASVSVKSLWRGREASVGFDLTGDLATRVVVRFLDAQDKALISYTRDPGANHALAIPDGAVSVRFGLRVQGSGTAFVYRVVLSPFPFDSVVRMSSNDTLLVTDNYPQYDNLYRNAFVHARVRRYRQHGHSLDVFRVRPSTALDYHEFEGVEVTTGTHAALRESLASGRYTTVVVHFLNEDMWAVLRDFQETVRIVVWIHGAEIQPWWRRSFNFSTDAEIEKAKAASEAREAFWQQMLSERRDSTHLVFVSQYFADEVQEDLKVTLPRDAYSVIHNPIDTEIFRYEPKSAEDRLKVVSLRPYASRVYANDLAVKAVLSLRDELWFEEMSFTFVGDGPLFDATTEPLLELPNVTVRRGFLDHRGIAELYGAHGVVLIPTRTDTHGVSRDEAMSAGLVPVTSAVAAVPEFIGPEEGYLAQFDDVAGLADALRELYERPDLFLEKSRAAAQRVRSQAAANLMIPAEAEVIWPVTTA